MGESAALATAHRVKLAVQLGSGPRSTYVVECACGWSSAIHWSKTRANDQYAQHKASG